MGQFDSLIPGNTATAPTSTSNQFANLIPKTAPIVQPQGTLLGQTIAGLPAASGIPKAFQAGLAQVVQPFKDKVSAGGKGVGPVKAAEGALNVGAGIVGMGFSFAAPITNLIGKAIDFAGNKLADVPAVQEFAKYSTPTDTRVLAALQNLGTVAMGLLGLKAGEIKSGDLTPEQTTTLAQHPEVIKAATEVGEAQKAVPPEAQAPLQKVINTSETVPTAPNGGEVVGQQKITNPTQFSRATGLSPAHQTLESASFDHVINNEDSILTAYKAEHGKVINADNFRPYFKDVGYEGHNAAGVQEPSSYLAKRARTEALKNPGDYAIGTAGGSGVGKTSAADVIPSIKDLHDKSAMVLDSNFSSIDSAHKFINEVQKSGKEFVGVFTYRDAIDSLENGIVKRMLTNPKEMGRLVPNEITAGNHIDSFDVVRQLVNEGHTFRFVDNSLGAGSAKEVSLSELEAKVKYPPREQLVKDFNAKVTQLYENKTPYRDSNGVEHTITKQQYEALIQKAESKGVKVQKTGEITRSASNINDALVKQGYEALPPEVQSKYTPESYKAELVKSKDLVANNYEDAVARATGSKPVGNYEGQILFNEVERVATEKGDYNTLTQLASSPLGKKLSLAAQTMGAHGFNDNPNSAVDAIRSVQAARETAVKAKGVDIPKQTDAIIKEIKRQTAAARSPRPTWEAFVEQITCGY